MAVSRLSTGEQISTVWHLGGLSVGQLAKKVLTGINQDDLIGRSGDLAFNSVLALFPMLIFLLSLLGFFASRGSAMRVHLVSYFYSVLPPRSRAGRRHNHARGHERRQQRQTYFRNCALNLVCFRRYELHD